MPGATTTEVSEILKDFYLGPIRDQLNSAALTLGRMRKNEDIVEGDTVVIPLRTGRNAGRLAQRESGSTIAGSSIGTASLVQAGRQNYDRITYPVKNNYAVVRVTGKLIAAARTNRGAFARALDEEVKGAVEDAMDDWNRQILGDGSGRIQTVDDITNAATGTLGVRGVWDYANQGTRLRFIVPGDFMAFEDYSAGGVQELDQASNLYLEVASVDLNAKTVTFVGAPDLTAGGTPVAVSDSLIKGINAATAPGIATSSYRGNNGAAAEAAAEMMGLVGLLSGANGWPRNSAEATYTAVPAGQVYCGSNGAGKVYADLFGLSGSSGLWAANMFFNSGVARPLSEDILQQAFDAAELNGVSTPSVAICEYGVRRAWFNVTLPDRRYGTNQMNRKGGHGDVPYNGLDFLPDKDAPEGAVMLINEDRLGVAQMSKPYWQDKDNSVLHLITGTDDYEAYLVWYAEAYTDRRNAHSVIGDIKVTS